MNRLRRAILGGVSGALCSATVARAASPHRSTKVVVIGGGFAGASCALALARSTAAIEVVLVDPSAQYATGPMSNSVIAGMRSFDSILVTRRGLQRAGVRHLQDRAVAVDPNRRIVSLAGGVALAYDRLVLAPGIRFLWDKLPGYSEAAARLMPHAWQAGEQTKILRRLLHELPDGAVFAISVPAGIMRCPPGPFERASLVAAFFKRHKPRCKLLIFDANNHFPRQSVFTDVWRELYPGMIEWIPVLDDGAVIRVDASRNTLYTAHQAHRVGAANIIPPQAPAQLAVQAGLATGHGWCPCDPHTFESNQVEGIHVIGDACIADPMPKSGSAAHAQGLQCAAAIVALTAGRAPPAPSFDSVCYSLLAPGKALSIHASFGVPGGTILQYPSPEQTQPPSLTREAQLAEQWYQRIVKGSFG